MKIPTTALTLKEWPAQERPRERLAALGAEALSDAEVVALLLGSGARGITALELARRILTTEGGIPGVARASAERLARQPGMGAAKCARLIAACELGRRRHSSAPTAFLAVTTSARAAELVTARLRDCGEERFVTLFLDVRHGLIRIEELARGGWTQAQLDPRVLYARALELGATALIVAHNHPSGDPQPSGEDVALTRRLAEGARLLGLRLLDHVIVGDGRYVSLADQGRIPA